MLRALTLLLFCTAGLALSLAGCAEQVWTVPVVPPAPPPQPAPVDPAPEPIKPPTQVATYEAVQRLAVGMTQAEVDALLGFPSVLTARMDDGRSIARWPCVNAEGKPRWCDVVFSPSGGLTGHAILPRAE
jgi:hypothetical protein